MTNSYIIVGAGRVGTALASFTDRSLIVRRGESIPSTSGPIIVCTRNDSLDTVLSLVPHERRPDLIFVQNGMIHSWLQENSLSNCTQALLYFAVSKRGETPVDGGGSVVCGPRAEAFAALLRAGNIQCTVVQPAALLALSVEKLLWNCTFGVLCQYYDQTVGEICRTQEAQARNLIAELQEVAQRELHIRLDDLVAQRLIDYSLSIPDYKGAVKEWPWRNGWFWDREQSPLHRHYLQRVITDL